MHQEIMEPADWSRRSRHSLEFLKNTICIYKKDLKKTKNRLSLHACLLDYVGFAAPGKISACALVRRLANSTFCNKLRDVSDCARGRFKEINSQITVLLNFT